MPSLVIARDRRVADVETAYDPERGNFNRLFATAIPAFREIADVSGQPTLKIPLRGRFVVQDIFTDFKRHDLGPAFHEREYDGTVRTEFLTPALWGVGTTAPVRPRRTEREPDGGDPPPWRRGPGRARPVRGAARRAAPGSCSCSSRRSCCFRPTTRRPTSIPAIAAIPNFPMFGAREHQAGSAVQRPEDSGVVAPGGRTGRRGVAPWCGRGGE